MKSTKDIKGTHNTHTTNSTHNTHTTSTYRTTTVLAIVVLLLLLVLIFIARISISIATNNIQLQYQLDQPRDDNPKIFNQDEITMFNDPYSWKNHAHNISLHPRPWTLLKEVDGLRNIDVVMVVASTGKNHGTYFRDRIIPSTRTWMRLLANVFIIIEDSNEIRFNLRHCIVKEYKSYTTLTCPTEATYILSRKCQDTYYYADGICCKVDDVLNFIANENIELFKHVKYLLQSDDDTFWRVDQLLRWLSAVDHALTRYGGIADSVALIGGPGKTPTPSKLAEEGGVWHIEGCKEIKTLGWYQPFMMNKVALERVKRSAAQYGLTETCRNFDVSQDVGIGVFAWVHKLIHIYIPGIEINPSHKGDAVFKADDMAVHGIRHTAEDDCEGKMAWPNEYKYDQQMTTGCGRIDKPGPYHNPVEGADMYDAWNWYAKNGKDLELGTNGINDWADVVDPSTGEIMSLPYIYPLKGYNTTKHFIDNDVTNKWKEFTLNDCKQKGKINHRSRRLRRQ